MDLPEPKISPEQVKGFYASATSGKDRTPDQTYGKLSFVFKQIKAGTCAMVDIAPAEKFQAQFMATAEAAIKMHMDAKFIHTAEQIRQEAAEVAAYNFSS